MQIEIKLAEEYEEPKIIIMTKQVTDEIKRIMEKIQNEQIQVITGFKDDVAVILAQDDIYRIFTQSNKVIAETKKGYYYLHLRLYEIEKLFKNNDFVRISNSDIINLTKVKSFDLSFTGTIHVNLLNGNETYVSRRYVTKIKQILGMRGRKK